MRGAISQDGVTLLGVAVFLAALSLMGTWILVGFQQRSALQSQRWKINAWKKTIEAKRDDITTLLLHPQNWRKILIDESNGNLHCRDCYTDATTSPPHIAASNCCQVNNSLQSINIMDLSGRPVVLTAADVGFKTNGELCSTFVLRNNRSDCVFRYDVRVKATCGILNQCDNAVFQVTGTLIVSEGVYQKFDVSPYSFGLSR